MTNFLYPPTPQANDEKLAPSLAFRKQVVKVMGSIILFFIVYVLLILAAIGLAIGCFYAGGALIIALPKLFTVIMGLGLMCVGVSVIFFLIKFVFSVSRNENSSRIELTEEEQPELFAFIRRLSKETHTPFPKKIFASADVNACVFYNSSFWSMFFPVKKNLEIGLGLVNSINISELKAVIAHEFGHFSQRSMKLGSFTYNVNKVIYNMLYENTSYYEFLGTWGRAHSYMTIFVSITLKIAQSIQWVLRFMYKIVNIRYMGLSREMEFHADAVAASVSGGNNLISSLSRIQIANGCYQEALNNATEFLKKNKRSKNIFENQQVIFTSWAQERHLPIKEQLPELSFQFINSISKSRINYKDQWASHPNLEERKIKLEELNINISPDETRAWQIFRSAGQLQEKMTTNLYLSVKIEGQAEMYDADYFKKYYLKEREKFKLPAVYQGFYDDRYIETEDWNFKELISRPVDIGFDQIFNTENGSLQSDIHNNENDLGLIKAIQGKQIDIKSFDFDGVKYSFKDCAEIIEKIEKEIAEKKLQQIELDKQAFVFFYLQAADAGRKVEGNYQRYQEISQLYSVYAASGNRILEIMQPFFQGGLTLEEINIAVAELKELVQARLKPSVQKMMEEGGLVPENDKDLYERTSAFLVKSPAYFSANQLESDPLNELKALIIDLSGKFNELKFMQYKKMLEGQFVIAHSLDQPSESAKHTINSDVCGGYK